MVQTIPVDVDGNFGGSVPLPGGAYELTVVAGDESRVVQWVGAGEVFVLFGHSFIQGGHDAARQLPATDSRVVTLLDSMTTKQNWFGQLTHSVGPFHDKPDFVGQLGDRLVNRLGVPVLFYGCAYGGSNIKQSYELLTGVNPRTSLPPGAREPTRQPLEPLERVMSEYVPKTGLRALLVEHGYNDRGTPKDRFKEQFRHVFDHIRNAYNKPALSIVLVQEELTAVPNSLYDIPTAQGLQELIQTYPNTWKGPDFNSAFWPNYHITSGKDHLYGVGIDQFAADWNTALSDDFFARSTAYVGSVPDVLPAVLYNAPQGVEIKAFDWLVLGLAAVVLLGVMVYRSKWMMWAFLFLGLIGLGRVTGKF